MRLVIALLSVALVAASAVPAAALSTASQQESYTGVHTSFETSSNAIVGYSVDGSTLMESVKVQSKSETQGSGELGVGVALSAVTQFTGAAVSVEAASDTNARLTTDSGAELRAHDNPRGVLVIDSGGESQYVGVELGSSAETTAESDTRVSVTNGDGSTGVFIVVGDGEVTVNDEGDLTAEIGEDGKLVFRAYPDTRDDEAKQQEQLIADGSAAAEVYLMQKSEGSAETVADIVTYSGDTTVEVIQSSEGTVRMTADRAESTGKIVITTVSKEAFRSADEIEVSVDGSAAAEASSYADLRSAIGGEKSKFLVRQAANADASAEVLVAVNHFSEREIAMRSTNGESDGGEAGSSGNTDGDATGGGDTGGTSQTPGQPGFGSAIAILAITLLMAFAHRRR